MILDTSFIIDLMDGDEKAIVKVKQLDKIQFVTTPTIFELWSGVMQSDNQEQEKRKVTDILESQIIIGLDKNSAEEAGKIDGILSKQGIFIDPEDSMIAGIAKTHNQPVLTRNIKHFGKIHDIKIETY